MPNLVRALMLSSLLMSVSSCASAPASVSSGLEELPTHGAIDESGGIRYFGAISDSANRVVFQSFERADPKPTAIVISSPGGGVAPALELGNWMLDHKLDVEIIGGCLSSCANYVFLAGRTKKLHRGSWVVWHGSTWSESFSGIADADRSAFLMSISGLREREAEFFRRIGVDNLITVHGQIEGMSMFSWRGFTHWIMRRGPVIGWDYSLRDLTRLGVTGIHLVDGEWAWREERPTVSGQVWRMALDDDYVFTMARYEPEAAGPLSR